MKNIFLVRHFRKVVFFSTAPYSALGDVRIVLVFGVFVCSANAWPLRLVIMRKAEAREKPRAGVFLFHTQMKVHQVTFICFPVLSFSVYAVMFPSSVSLTYAEIMKLGMISEILRAQLSRVSHTLSELGSFLCV